MAITNQQQSDILKVVVGLFNAAPGGTYMTDLAAQVEAGTTIAQLADGLAANTVFTNGIMAGKVTTASQVAVLLNNFGLAAGNADPASAAAQAEFFFTTRIDDGVGIGAIVYEAVTFLSATTEPAFLETATLLANKALVAASYSASNSSIDLSTLQNVVHNVEGTAPYTDADVATVLASINDTTAPVVTEPTANFSFAEGQGAAATLATVAATDNIAVSAFNIVSGNDSGFFAIDATGNITLTEAGLTSAANDFETTPNSFTLGVTAKDSANNVSAAVNVVLDVSDVDEVAPALSAQVLAGNKVILTFDEAFDAASIPAGSSFLVTESGTTNIAISAVTVSGQIVTLTLATTPTGTTTVSYTPPGTSPLQDAAGNDADAFSNKTLTIDTTAPTLSSSTPADNATAVVIDNNLVLTFSETVQAGTGNIVITNASDATDTRTIAVTDTTQVTFSGSTVTINPTADLKGSANYNVQIAATAVKDSAGNAYAGITDSTTLNFATLVSAGTTFVLTTSLENLTGTDNDDLFIGDNTTLTADVINGGSGTDKLTITNGGSTYTTTPTLTSVETLQVTDSGTTAGASFNLNNSTGIKTIISSGSTNTASAMAFNNVAAIADLQINNTIGAVGQTVTYVAAAVAGASDTQKVSLTAANMTGTLTVAGVETLAFTAASGASTIGTVVDAALTKVTVDGAGDLTITAPLIGATTIDASLATGAVNVAAATAAPLNIAFTGGSGNDTINMAGTLNTADTLNGGTGTDTLRLLSEATYTTSAATNVTNFETLQLDTASTSTLDLSLYGATNVFKTVTLGSSGSESLGLVAGQTVTITNGVTGSAINVDLNAATTGAVSFALASNGTADALTLNLRNTDTNSGGVVNETVGTFTASTVEDLTITANNAVVSGATFESDNLGVATLSAAAATKLTITGGSAVLIGGTASTLTALATVDASTMTKNVTLGNGTTTVFNTVNTGAAITTGSGDDSVSLDVGATGVLKAIALGTSGVVTTATGDTLTLKSASGTGSTIIDLSSTTDQISQLLGSANSAAQTGIEHINLSTFDQTTATSQITGSAEINNITGADGVDTINAGAGNDVITGGLGADSMSGGSGADTFRFGLLADVTLGTPDTVGDFVQAAGGDILSFNANGAGSFAIVSGTSTADQVIDGFEVVAGAAHSPNSEISIITTAVVGALTSANAATAIGSATGAYAATDFKLFVVSNGTDAAVFYFDSAAADATVIAAELGAGPIITLTGIDSTELAALAAGNFSFSA